jgi:two-component system LytT family response regulator
MWRIQYKNRDKKVIKMIRTIIIDDEEKSRKLLVNLLDLYCNNVEVLDLADSVESGLGAIEKHQPELIFLDIIMPDGDGFSLLAKLEKINFEVIFTTAYGEYAIKALRENALDYLLKPIDVEELQNAVKRARKKINLKSADIESTVGNKLANLLEKYNHLNIHVDKIGIPNQDGLKFISINDITLCKAEGNYTEIYFVDSSKKEVVSKTLKDFEQLLKSYNFLRIHRSYLINLNNIKEYHRVNHSADTEGNGGCVVLINGLIVPVSRDRRKQLLSKYARPI